MSSRLAIKAGAALTAATALAGCSSADLYLDRRDSVSLARRSR